MDMRTHLELHQKRASEVNGFKEPDLNEIVFEGEPNTKQEIESALKILNIRRQILERVTARRQVLGRMKRHEADAMKARNLLFEHKDDPVLNLELEGRIEESHAKAVACLEKAKQYELEIAVWMKTLIKGETKKWHSQTHWTWTLVILPKQAIMIPLQIIRNLIARLRMLITTST